MFQYPQPPAPAGFDQAMKAQRDRLEALFAAGKLEKKDQPRVPRGAPRPPKDPDYFPDLWGQFKPVLAAAQREKCAFCEGAVTAQQRGDVEHFAPKAEIHELGTDRKTWGIETPFSANVKGRKGTRVGRNGYWWLAYDWSNYILACQICNQAWKMNFFPIAESRAADAPLRGASETELLLHPFRGPPPAQHLAFGRKGEVRTRIPPGDTEPSVRGEQTIRTLGLDRIALRERRQPIARHIHETIDDILSPTATPAEVRIHLKHIHARGRADELHCGMVRAIFEERLPMTWSELEAQFGGSGT